jgi:hypothetical protein
MRCCTCVLGIKILAICFEQGNEYCYNRIFQSLFFMRLHDIWYPVDSFGFVLYSVLRSTVSSTFWVLTTVLVPEALSNLSHYTCCWAAICLKNKIATAEQLYTYPPPVFRVSTCCLQWWRTNLPIHRTVQYWYSTSITNLCAHNALVQLCSLLVKRFSVSNCQAVVCVKW